jgi:WD40 repeat protein
MAIFDIRQIEQPLVMAPIHDSAVTSLSVCRVAEIIASTGEDGFCRLWKCSDGLELFAEHNVTSGRLYTSAFSPDRPTLLAFAGDGDETQIWDIANLLEGTP